MARLLVETLNYLSLLLIDGRLTSSHSVVATNLMIHFKKEPYGYFFAYILYYLWHIIILFYMGVHSSSKCAICVPNENAVNYILDLDWLITRHCCLYQLNWSCIEMSVQTILIDLIMWSNVIVCVACADVIWNI